MAYISAELAALRIRIEAMERRLIECERKKPCHCSELQKIDQACAICRSFNADRYNGHCGVNMGNETMETNQRKLHWQPFQFKSCDDYWGNKIWKAELVAPPGPGQYGQYESYDKRAESIKSKSETPIQCSVSKVEPIKRIEKANHNRREAKNCKNLARDAETFNRLRLHGVPSFVLSRPWSEGDIVND